MIGHYDQQTKMAMRIADLKKRLAAYESDDSYAALRDYYERRIGILDHHVNDYRTALENAHQANNRLKNEDKDLRENLQKEKEKYKAEAEQRAKAEKLAAVLQTRYDRSCEEKEELNAKIIEQAERIAALEEEIRKLKAQLSADAETTGLPTSQTPIGKKKYIPNTRPKTDRKPGGQPGHAKSALKGFSSEEATETVEHTLPDGTKCSVCGGDLVMLDEGRVKCETDLEVRIIRRRHVFRRYLCLKCGTIVNVPVPSNLKEENQYGTEIQAAALAILDRGFVSVQRTRDLINGLAQNQIETSEGFVGKLQSRAAKYLGPFIEDLKEQLLKEDLIYWDDTVVFLETARGCLRFYGNDRIALYAGHRKKDLAGIEEDNILSRLPKTVKVMHDHNKVNYNPQFIYQNLECNQHLERDLEKLSVNSGHKWAEKLRDLIRETIHRRKELIGKGTSGFTQNEIDEFGRQLEECLKLGREECEAAPNHYYTHDERVLLRRIEEYRENYFAWISDFSLPTTNNLSERGLRFIKTHQKVSGQFREERTIQEFAAVQSYLETCRRNGKEVMDAARRLMRGEPYTVAELFAD